MKNVPPTLLIGLVSMALGRADAQGTTVKQELDRLQGSFSMLRGEADGQAMPTAMAAGMKRVVEGNVTTVTMAGQLYMKATISVNPGVAPRTIDYQMTAGFTAGKTQLGIYRASGDTVTLCFGSPGKDRPTEFAAPSGSGVTCSVWKRDRP
jgi:uncharacterized protein (TIGR03067 family)